jgi:peptide/nickel transport system substrate-binding protein
LKAGTALGFASTAFPAAQAQTGSTFVFANPVEYDTLDPHTVFDYSRVATRLNFYDGLYRWLDNPPKLTPWLAESHTVSGQRPRLSLQAEGQRQVPRRQPGDRRRRGLHDGAHARHQQGPGRAVQPDHQAGHHQGGRRSTVEFNLVRPRPPSCRRCPRSMSSTPSSEGQHQGDDWGQAWLSSNVAGSGSYKLERYDPAVGVIGVAIPTTSCRGRPSTSSASTCAPCASSRPKVLGLIKGDYHGLDGFMPADALDRLRKANTVQIIEQPSMRLFILHLNNQRAPLNDVHVAAPSAWPSTTRASSPTS